MEIIKFNKRTSFLALSIVFLMCLFACKKDNNSDAAYARPVVEAYLVPGKPIQVKVYYQKYLEDTTTYGSPIIGLALKISDGSRTVTLTESVAGTYVYTDSSFIADSHTYSLNFDYNNQVISAQTTVPNKPTGFTASAVLQHVPSFSLDSTPTFVPVTYTWNNTSSDYFMIAFRNIDSFPAQLDARSFVSYRDTEVILNKVATYETGRMTFSYEGNYKVLLFHINKEYSDALTNSGRSSLNLTSPNTNVVNGLGIFTAMQADTLNLRVYQ